MLSKLPTSKQLLCAYYGLLNRPLATYLGPSIASANIISTTHWNFQLSCRFNLPPLLFTSTPIHLHSHSPLLLFTFRYAMALATSLYIYNPPAASNRPKPPFLLHSTSISTYTPLQFQSCLQATYIVLTAILLLLRLGLAWSRSPHTLVPLLWTRFWFSTI